MPDPLIVERHNAVVFVRLNRPDVRNALNQEAIAAITRAFADFERDDGIRAVVLSGEGSAFCGGADINYMRESLEWTPAENEQDALRLASMYAAVDGSPAPVIGKIHGPCLGGGAGLAAACDIAVASDDALFGFTEAKLGIVPAVISPFVLRKIGQSHARALFTTAERFDAQLALRIGLVHEVAAKTDLDAAVRRKIDEVLSSGPRAARAAKEIARTVGALSAEEARGRTARLTAERRTSDEGQEGLRAFLEKRKPSWR